ncbi:hypothetical protein CVS40_5363 [Lucilia cuprina]|nr:hypothetical protein CVS40_5363 [Lucilia cuprina]
MKCEVCHNIIYALKPFLKKRHMLQHETGSKDFACKECDKAFVSAISTKKHTRAVHNNLTG